MERFAAGMSRACRRADAADDGRGTEEDEAAEDDHRAVAPVDAAGEHGETDGGDGNDRGDGGCGSEQSALQPGQRIDNHTRAFGIGNGGRRRRRCQRSERKCSHFAERMSQGHHPRDFWTFTEGAMVTAIESTILPIIHHAKAI